MTAAFEEGACAGPTSLSDADSTIELFSSCLMSANSLVQIKRLCRNDWLGLGCQMQLYNMAGQGRRTMHDVFKVLAWAKDGPV
jgi:hypothetical protein